MTIASATVSATVLADILGVSKQRVNQLAAARVLPRAELGFELRAAVRAYIDNLREESRPADLADAQARLTAAKARMAELELQRMEGESVAIEAVAHAVAGEYATVRQRLLAIPSRVTPHVLGVADHREVHRAIEAAVIEALTELSADTASSFAAQETA